MAQRHTETAIYRTDASRWSGLGAAEVPTPPKEKPSLATVAVVGAAFVGLVYLALASMSSRPSRPSRARRAGYGGR